MNKVKNNLIENLEDVIRILESELESFKSETDIDKLEIGCAAVAELMESKSDEFESYRKEFAESGIQSLSNKQAIDAKRLNDSTDRGESRSNKESNIINEIVA